MSVACLPANHPHRPLTVGFDPEGWAFWRLRPLHVFQPGVLSLQVLLAVYNDLMGWRSANGRWQLADSLTVT